MASFQETAGNLIGGAFSSILIFGLVFIVMGVVLGVVFYFVYWRRKFDIEVLIRSKRANKDSYFKDKAAIIFDRNTKNRYFRLLDTKIDLPVPNYEKSFVRLNKGDFLFLYKLSEEEILPLTMGDINIKQVLSPDGKLKSIAELKQLLVESDVGYWNIKRKDKNKKLFDTESMLMKILPYMPLLLGGIFMVFTLYILFDSLPGLIKELTNLTRELKSLKGGNN